MDFYKELLKIKDEELEEFIETKVMATELETVIEYPEDDEVVIGYCLQKNPQNKLLFENIDEEFFDVEINCFHSGYIKKGSKMVYGMTFDNEGNTANEGSYYYVDDDRYIYDFCSYIRQFNIINEYELMDYILEFLRGYFGYLPTIKREEMFQLLMGTNNRYLEPNNNHGLSWFKGRGNAQCSEYSLLAQNIMTIFGIDSYLIIGREITGCDKGESHAFNIVDFVEEESQEEVQLLVDFSNYVNVYDINFNKCGESPFMGELKCFDENFVDELVSGEKHILFDDYSYMLINDSLVHLVYNRKRDYYIANELIPDSYSVKSKK